MIRETGKLPSSSARNFTQANMSEGTEMLVLTNTVCTGHFLLLGSNEWQQKVEKNISPGCSPHKKTLDTPMNTACAGEKIFFALVVKSVTGEDMKEPNFIKVSVSLPPEVHEWLKSEATRRTKKFGESWTASRVLQEALREYRSRHIVTATLGQAMPDRISLNEDFSDPQPSPGDIVQPHKASAGGSKIAKTRYPTKRQAKS